VPRPCARPPNEASRSAVSPAPHFLLAPTSRTHPRALSVSRWERGGHRVRGVGIELRRRELGVLTGGVYHAKLELCRHLPCMRPFVVWQVWIDCQRAMPDANPTAGDGARARASATPPGPSLAFWPVRRASNTVTRVCNCSRSLLQRPPDDMAGRELVLTPQSWFVFVWRPMAPSA